MKDYKKQNKLQVSRVISSSINSPSIQLININSQRPANPIFQNIIQLGAKKRKKYVPLVETPPTHTLNTFLAFGGVNYNLNFTSGHTIYEGTITHAAIGAFTLMVHGTHKTYTTHLTITGFRSPTSSSLATFEVYGYGTDITHLEERSST